jgi:hypothetical protein
VTRCNFACGGTIYVHSLESPLSSMAEKSVYRTLARMAPGNGVGVRCLERARGSLSGEGRSIGVNVVRGVTGGGG